MSKNNPTNSTSEGASKKLVPELRFPEFVNEGEWMEQLLGHCLSQTPDYGLNAPAIIIRKTKCSRFSERIVLFSKTKRSSGGFYTPLPTPIFQGRSNAIPTTF